MKLAAGARLGPYEILEGLGCGRLGELYRAGDAGRERKVALRILAPAVLAGAEARGRLVRHVRALSHLRHVNLAAVYGLEEHEGEPLLLSEYVGGPSLEARLARGAPAAAEIFQWGGMMADALDLAHSRGLAHGDLAPSNVLLTSDGLKLTDFGVAAAAGLPGDSLYRAPEQVRGQPAHARSDLFALGAILYEMAAGRKAFDSEAAILYREPPPLSAIDPRSSTGLDALLRRALAKDPERRWQSASELRWTLAWAADRPEATRRG